MDGEENDRDPIEMGEQDLENLLEKTVRFENVFLERKEQLRKALESMVNTSSNIDDMTTIRLLNVALSGVGERDDGDINAAAMGFIHLIVSQRTDAASILNDYDASSDFVDFILNLIIYFGTELQRINHRKIQGNNWWDSFSTDLVVKDESVAHTHNISIDIDREFKIDSSPKSDLYIVSHLLNKYIAASNSPYTNADDVVDLEEINRIRALILAIEQGLEDQGAELHDQEELIEMIDDSESEHSPPSSEETI